VTAEDALEFDDNILLTRPDGHQVYANFVGRDPGTDIALLQCEEWPIADIGFSGTSELRVGNLILAVGRQPEGLNAAFGTLALAGGPWSSLRGSPIDRKLHLNLRLDATSEGGVALDIDGRILGMTVLDAQGHVLVIPSETIERVTEQLLSHGRPTRGYLGLGVQPKSIDQPIAGIEDIPESIGLIVNSVDANGPAHQAGIKQGDILMRWNTYPLRSIHDICMQLRSEGVGNSITIEILRDGKQLSLNVEVAERFNTPD
jgi:S1-C subfamily serine protease